MANVISAQSILEAAREARAFSASEEQVAAARDTLAWLKETRALLEKTRAEGGKLHTVTDFTGKSDAFKKFLFDTLDSGEIRIMLEGGQVRMEETGVPTVWRIMIGKQDMLVTAYIPEVVTTYSSRAELEDIVEPEKQPEGYHWYLVGKDLKLKPESVVSLWRGAFVPLDGVVCDNSELGQKYDVYASVKIEGGDVYATGKATENTVYYVDQVAVVRKTLNSEGSK